MSALRQGLLDSAAVGADRLAGPLGTVKTRLYHGLRAFKQALVDRGVET